MRRVLGWTIVLLTAAIPGWHARGADEAALRAALDDLAGEWTGEAKVSAMDGFVLKTLGASRRVAWEGDVLRVETTLADDSSEYVVVGRLGIHLGRLEASVSRPGQPEDRYLGELAGGALVWTNAEGNRRDAREQVTERGGELVLETATVEPMRALGLSGLVRIESRYHRPAPAPAASSPSGVAAASGDDGLKRALEAERQASATMRTRLEEAERRVAAAESQAGADAAVAVELEQARARLAELEGDRASLRDRLAAEETRSTGAAREADAGKQARAALEGGIAQRDGELAALAKERDELLRRLEAVEASVAENRRANEELRAANGRIEQERAGLESRASELERRLAQLPSSTVAPSAAPMPAAGSTDGAVASREQMITEVQQMERRVLELESERNAAREQVGLMQRQLEDTRRLRDDTLLRFQTVVSELNAMREEKERLARANVSLQAEVRTAQQGARGAGGAGATNTTGPAAVPAAPATTFDGKTADMVIAALQIIGVTRGEEEDKAILDGRVYRNGDLVEAQLGIVFLRIEGNALVFQDRRGREYRRRF